MSKKRIGNTTDSPRNSEKIQALNAQYSQEIDAYKRFAEARRNRRRYTQEQLGVYLDKLDTYVEEATASHTPMTQAGTLLALGLTRDTWQAFGRGEYDYLLEEYIIHNNIPDEAITYAHDDVPTYVDDDGQAVPLIPYSILKEKSDLILQNQRELACSSTRGNPAGNIFLLKAQLGMREEDAPTHVSQTLVIADAEQAREAMKLLK